MFQIWKEQPPTPSDLQFVPKAQRPEEGDAGVADKPGSKLAQKLRSGVHIIQQYRDISEHNMNELYACIELLENPDTVPFQWDTSIYTRPVQPYAGQFGKAVLPTVDEKEVEEIKSIRTWNSLVAREVCVIHTEKEPWWRLARYVCVCVFFG